MTLLRAYGKKKEKQIAEMFDSNGEPIFDDLELFNAYVEKIPIGMKRKTIFYELLYWEHLKITHLQDPNNIFKNVSSSLWSHIPSKQSVTLIVNRDLISSNNKKKHFPRQENRGEDDPYWLFKDSNVPCVLKKYDLSLENEVILGVKAPSLYGYTL